MSLPHTPVPPSGTPLPRPPARKAGPARGLLIGGGTLAVLLAAWAGSTAYSAGQAEQVGNNAATTLDTALKANRLGRVERHTFARGLTESTDDIFIVLDGDLLDDGPDAYKLHLRNHIKNGPLPGFTELGQAAVDSEIIWDARTQAALDKAFAGKKPTIHTLVGLGGSTATTIQIPAGGYGEGKAAATWTALGGQLQVTEAGRGMNGTLSWPGGTLGSREGMVSLKDLRYSIDQRPYLKALSQGKASFSVASIELPASAGQAAGRLSGLSMVTTTAPSGANLGSRTDFSAASLSAGGQTYSNLKFVLSASNLSSAALETISETLRKPEYQQALKNDTGPQAQQAALQKLLVELKPALRALLAGNPLLAVNEVSVQTPQGPLKLALGAQVVDGGSIPLDSLLSEQSLKAEVSNPQLLGLLGNLKLSADISGNQQMIAGLMNSSGDRTAASLAQSIDPMVEQGLITRSGDLLTTRLEFGKGGATINGKPVPMQ